MFNTYAVTVGDSLWNAIYENMDSEKYSINGVFEEDGQKFAVLQNREDNSYSRMNFSFENDEFSHEDMTALEDYTPSEEPQFALADVEAFETEFKKKDDKEGDKAAEGEGEKEPAEDGEKKPAEDGEKKPAEGDGEGASSEEDEGDDEDKKKKKNKFNLEEIEEYIALRNERDELQAKYSALEATVAGLNETIQSLTTFKNKVERAQKEELINTTFYMLSDEDKKEVVENIDKYTLDEVEAKLAVICVRNKVNFNLDDDNSNNGAGGPVVYNLGDDAVDSSTPAWVKALDHVAKSMR